MKYAIVFALAQVLLATCAVAAVGEYRTLAEKPLGGGRALRAVRGPDIQADRLSGIPFLAKRIARGTEFFGLRLDVCSQDGEAVTLAHTVWPSKAPDVGSGFKVLALDADANGVIMIVASISTVFAMTVDSSGQFTISVLHNYAETAVLSVDAAPNLFTAIVSKTGDGRWSIATSSGKNGANYLFEESEDRSSFKKLCHTLRGVDLLEGSRQKGPLD